MKKILLPLVSLVCGAASAVVYRPGLLQARFSGSSLVPKGGEATLVENLRTQTDYGMVGSLDCTYGTLMANANGGNGETVYNNIWSGSTYQWSDYSLFAYEGEIFVEAGQTLAIGGCFDDGTAAKVNGSMLFHQGTQSGYNIDCTFDGTFTPTTTGWYPISAWVYDWEGGKNIRSGYVSGIAYNLVGDQSQPTDSSVWKKLTDDGKMSLLRVKTDESFLHVRQVGLDNDDLKVQLDASGMPASCAAADVVICWGATDAGPATNGWDHVASVGQVVQAAKSVSFVFTVVGAAPDAAVVRVCLSYIDPAAANTLAVSSFADWSDPVAPASTFDAVASTEASGSISLVRGDYIDFQASGVVGYFGDGASSASVSVQFSTSSAFSGEIVETSAVSAALGEPVLFPPLSATYGKGAGYLRLKMVNDLDVTSYSEPIAYTPPAVVDFEDYEMKVTFAVAGDYADVEGFPVLVRLSEGSPAGFSYDDCEEGGNGRDLAFFDAAGTVRYPFEIDTWNTDGESLVWVRLPSASKGASFVMCYGRDGQASASDGALVWKGNVGVWHMGEASGNLADSTGNGYTGVPSMGSSGTTPAAEAMVATDGPVGKARNNQTVNLNNGYYTSIADSNRLLLGEAFSLSGWFRINDRSGSSRLFSRKTSYNAGEGFEIELRDKNSVGIRGGGGTQQSFAIKDLTTDWAYLTFVYSGTTVTTYQDGVLVDAKTVETPTDNGKPISIGCNSNGSETSLNGDYDEVRFSLGAKSASRVAAEYATMADPSFLVSSGAISTSQNMPVIADASVTWDDGTKVTLSLASGIGSASAVFTDVATGTDYVVPLGDSFDATAGAQSWTIPVAASDLPAGKIYTWTVVVTNASLGRSMSAAGEMPYYSGAADASVRFVATTGDDANDGLTTGTAKATIQSAVDALGTAGGTVYVGPGTYVLDPPAQYDPVVTITTPVVVVGQTANAADVVITRGSTQARGFKLDNAGACLRHLTLDGFFLQSANSTIAGALWILAGAVEDCVVSNASGGHWDSRGAGAYMEGGRISRCVFKGCAINWHDNYGAAVYAKGSALVEDCLIVENTCGKAAAVCLEGSAVMINCTIADNVGRTTEEGGRSGVWARSASARVVNCAIFRNSGASEQKVIWDGTAACFVNCASERAIEGGVDCIAGDPCFVIGDEIDRHFTFISPCVDAGTLRASYGATSTADLDGSARVAGSAVDIGCYEYKSGTFDATFSYEIGGFVTPATVTFTAASASAQGPVQYSWDFDGDGTVDLTTDETTVPWTFTAPGEKTVVMTATDGVSTSREVRLTNYIHVGPPVIYVDAGNAANKVYPYTTLETATADLQEALDLAADGTTVLVADGTYTREVGGERTLNGFYLSNGVHLASISGDPAACIIKSTIRATWNNFFHRCLNVDNPLAFVTGFTFADGSLEQEQAGACLCIAGSGGTVSNCVIRGGRTTNWAADGAGAYVSARGFLTHSVIEGCQSLTSPKQTEHSVLHVEGTVANCLVRNCGSDSSHNIVKVNNGGKLLNCTIVDSVCRTNYFEEAWRTDQSGIRAASGALVQNCVVVGVTRGEEVEGEGRVVAPWTGSAASFVNCATDGAAPVNETCRLVDTSAFVDYDGGDYRPNPKGPLANAGADYEGMSPVDLAGNARRVSFSVDIGCYESERKGFAVLIR